MSDALRDTRCFACGHPANFHSNGRKPCGVVGCDCECWMGSIIGVANTVSLSRVSRHLHKDIDWVRRHATDLGAITVSVETPEGNRDILRFRMEDVLLRAPDVLDRP